MSINEFIRAMPKVELHVHLEGSIQPETLLQLARRNRVSLPVESVAGLQQWYQVKDFSHFLEVYFATSTCICTAQDIEIIAREFLQSQAAQQIRYSEVIFTPYTHFKSNSRIPIDDQLSALSRARDWALAELGIDVSWVFDFSRNVRPVEHSLTVAEWAVAGKEIGVVGFGVGGPEVGNPPELFTAAFDRARSAGLASLPHAGETVGPQSIWGAIDALHADRIGHGVRCLEDPALVELLRDRQIPLDISPTSNVCLGVVPTFVVHPLPRLLAQGLYVTINSDDPPMFNTTLTNEFIQAANAFGLGAKELEALTLNGVRASRLPQERRQAMKLQMRMECAQLRSEYQL